MVAGLTIHSTSRFVLRISFNEFAGANIDSLHNVLS